MVQHIYGHDNVMTDKKRPNVFVNELKMYVAYLKNEIQELLHTTPAALKKWQNFKNNLLEGIAYYENLLPATFYFEDMKTTIQKQLEQFKQEISSIVIPTSAMQ